MLSSSTFTASKEITFNCLVYAERANLIFLWACSSNHLNCVKMSQSLTDCWVSTSSHCFMLQLISEYEIHYAHKQEKRGEIDIRNTLILCYSRKSLCVRIILSQFTWNRVYFSANQCDCSPKVHVARSTFDDTQLLLSITMCSFQRIIIILHMHAIYLFRHFSERSEFIISLVRSMRSRWNNSFSLLVLCLLTDFTWAEPHVRSCKTASRNNCGSSMRMKHTHTTLACEWNEKQVKLFRVKSTSNESSL